MSTDPPDYSGDDNEEARESECELYGHSFEGYDEFSEVCSSCGEIREYATREREHRNAASGNDIHICWTAGDHSFGMDRVCLYVNTPPATGLDAIHAVR